jgi:hypothetical protein
VTLHVRHSQIETSPGPRSYATRQTQNRDPGCFRGLPVATMAEYSSTTIAMERITYKNHGTGQFVSENPHETNI